MCMLMGYLTAVPIPNKHVEMVMSAYVNHIYAREGSSKYIPSDRGTEFTAKTFMEVVNKLGMKLVTTTPRSPQSNTPLERAHHHLRNSIRKLKINQPTIDWDYALAPITCSYNIMPVTKLTGECPFYLFKCHDPFIPNLQALVNQQILFMETTMV